MQWPLFGLNALSENKLNFEQMSQLSAKVGSDCPSFLIPGTCVASGRGERCDKWIGPCRIEFRVERFSCSSLSLDFQLQRFTVDL